MKIAIGTRVKWSAEGFMRLRVSTRELLNRIGEIGVVVHEFNELGTFAVKFPGKDSNGKDVIHNIPLHYIALAEFPDPPIKPKAGSLIDDWIRWACDAIDHRAALACARIKLAAN